MESSTEDIVGTHVKLVWHEETDFDSDDYEGDPNYKGYWATESIEPEKRNLSYTFSIEKIHENIIIKDLDADYPLDDELDDLIEALELIRNMRTKLQAKE